MNTQPIATPSSTLDLGDIYYVLFRHKWKILLCSLAGIATAISLYRSESPPYQSEAKLLVRYIISQDKPGGMVGAGAETKRISPDERGASIMNTEVEILTSLDLAENVARTIGPEKLLAKAGGGSDLSAATGLLRSNLNVTVGQASSVIHISFRHPDAELVQNVLREIIDRYFKHHIDAHRSAGVIQDSLIAESETLRSRLNQTEDDLRRAVNRAGGIAPEMAKEVLNNQLVAIRREIGGYETDLAARLAIYEELSKRQGPAPAPTEKGETVPEVAPSVLDEFKALMNQINRYQTSEQELLLQFTPGSSRVQAVKALRVEAEEKLAAMRAEHPGLVRVAPTQDNKTAADRDALEATTAWIQIKGLQAKIKELNNQSNNLKAEAARLDKEEGAINELKRSKDLQELNYRNYQSSLEAARINQTLGEGKAPNLTVIQKPSAAFRAKMDMKKIGLSAVIGIAGGLAWAFLIELYFDRSVRRPKDLQKFLRAPLFLSIPTLKGSQLSLPAGRLALGNGKNSSEANGQAAAPITFGPGNALQPFHETLRDRLIGYFESRNLTHKPKLVAVTGLRKDSGVTTTATGLARSLSETGEGNVLLVDMTAEQGSAQQFAKGNACSLDEVLETRSQAHIHENLYVVSETSNSEKLSRNLPQRFTRLVPKLKASDFDYIIFDMPPVSQLSITPRLAGFMDMVLMVVESEKTDREVVDGACSLLADSKAHIGFVLNKTKHYVPTGLQQQLSAG